MTTSNDYTWNPSTYKVITGALRLLGAIQSGEAPPPEEWDDALDALNGLMKQFQASGLHLWAETDCTLFLQQGQNRYLLGNVDESASNPNDFCCLSTQWAQSYLVNDQVAGDTAIVLPPGAPVADKIATNGTTAIGILLDAPSNQYFWVGVTNYARDPNGLGWDLTIWAPLPSRASAGARVIIYGNQSVDIPRPLRVPAARRYLYPGNLGYPTAIETPLSVYSRLDYAAVPNKDTLGEVTAFFYDPQLLRGVFHVWPTPASPHQAVKFTAMRPLQDFDNQRDTADLPVEMISCLRYNLAAELAPEYDCPAERFQIIKSTAAEKLMTCMAWDREPESVYIGVSSFPAGRNT